LCSHLGLPSGSVLEGQYLSLNRALLCRRRGGRTSPKSGETSASETHFAPALNRPALTARYTAGARITTQSTDSRIPCPPASCF